jgi:hypothetical protein
MIGDREVVGGIDQRSGLRLFMDECKRNHPLAVRLMKGNRVVAEQQAPTEKR